MEEPERLSTIQETPSHASPTSFCQVTGGQRFEHEGLTLYYEVLGPGPGTPLVVLNGGPGVDHTYLHCSDVWGRLALHRPVLFYDPRGTGRSSRLTAGQSCTFPDQFQDLAALLGHLAWTQVDLLGHSFGGNVAMAFVARYPDRARRLILVDSGPPQDIDKFMLFKEIYPEQSAQWDTLELAYTLGDEEAIRQSWMVYFSMLFYSPEKRDAFLAQVTGDSAVLDVNEKVWSDVKRFNLWPELAKFDLPTLVITGRFDANIAPAVAYKIHKAIAGSRFAVFERSGHKPFYEEPEAFEALVEEFLGTVQKPT